MYISALDNGNQLSFGHSFRVSICLKNENGIGETFVNPATQTQLYKSLNSKISGWLNEDYLSNLRNILGKPRKVQKFQCSNDLPKQMVKELKAIDTDYAQFSIVHSVSRPSKLNYIATGVDVSILENLKGFKHLGLAKADSKRYYGTSKTPYIKGLAKITKGNALDYVQDENVLLRSKNNKEIMLKTVFKAVKGKNGKIHYELDSYEFHENKSKPTLLPLSRKFHHYKYNSGTFEEIKKIFNIT